MLHNAWLIRHVIYCNNVNTQCISKEHVNIFKLSFNTTRETQLQSFQYRIIHRTITYCIKLSDVNLICSSKCLFCNEIDNIRHFLLFCPKSSQFLAFLLPVLEQNGTFIHSSRLWLSGRIYYLWLSPQAGDLWSPHFVF